MANYAKSLARDQGGAAMQEFPAPYPAVARVQTENAVVSSAISLNPNTTEVEVFAFGGQGIAIRWVPTTETAAAAGAKASIVASGLGANFDHIVPEGTVRKFVVPKETQGTYAGQVGSINGLYQRLARINAGALASSVLIAEY